MARYEYRVLTDDLLGTSGVDVEDLESVLNKAGNEGFRLKALEAFGRVEGDADGIFTLGCGVIAVLERCMDDA